MFVLPNLIVCAILFVSVFFEVFLLLTFLENKGAMKKKDDTLPQDLPTATIVVPCFNEEESIFGTVESLLALDYPKNKLKIMIIDDGSTDNSWSLMQKYKDNPIIELHKKENGGKHTALNYAISKSKSDIIGCLDADSFVSPNALKDIAAYFSNEETMAVTPAIKIHEPDNILRMVQKVEYDWGIFLRKMLSFIDALYVTPGPFSFFRRKVFENLGSYKKAHNTEDMEMAMRLQTHGYKIKNCHTAFVYTIAPQNFSKLFIQRLRWTYGFLKNVIDYKHLFFNRTQGNLGFFVLPVMIISAFSTLWMTGFFLFNIGSKIKTVFANWQSINFDFLPLSHFKFNPEWFYINTGVVNFVAILSFTLMIAFILLGRRISEGKIKIKMDLFYFLIIYPFIAPTWLIKSVYNILVSKKAAWR
jgi:cellulose synthase/poly-beta-1,6-N-acetylglucosamine synthase-like glycosyltransferase